MVTRYALLKNGIVANICLWDGVTPWTPPAGTALVNVEGMWCDIGALYDGKVFTPDLTPKPPPPKTVEERLTALEAKTAALPAV